MSMIAAAVKHMLAAGMSHDAIVSAVEDMEASARPVRSSNAERQARYRARKAERECVTSNVTSVTCVTDVTTKEIPPTPPKEKTPSKEKNPPKGGQKKKSSPLPEGWKPDDEVWAWSVDQLGGQRAASEVERFRDWARGGGKLYADWTATWRNWVRRSLEFKPRIGLVSASPQSPPETARVKFFPDGSEVPDPEKDPEAFRVAMHEYHQGKRGKASASG